jgi:hypothetical protein
VCTCVLYASLHTVFVAVQVCAVCMLVRVLCAFGVYCVLCTCMCVICARSVCMYVCARMHVHIRSQDGLLGSVSAEGEQVTSSVQ